VALYALGKKKISRILVTVKDLVADRNAVPLFALERSVPFSFIHKLILRVEVFDDCTGAGVCWRTGTYAGGSGSFTERRQHGGFFSPLQPRTENVDSRSRLALIFPGA